MRILLKLFLISLLICGCDQYRFYEKMYEYDLNESYEGLILDKEIDLQDHSARNLKLPNKTISVISEFYELIEIGDSINKKKGDTLIYLYKKNGELLKFNYNEHHREINPSAEDYIIKNNNE